MNTKERTWKIINDLLQNRDRTELHITEIRHCDFKDNVDAFIEKASKTMWKISFLPEKTPYDHEAVSCRYGKDRVGYIATYDLEPYYILAEKKDTNPHTTQRFGRFSTCDNHDMLKVFIPHVVTMDDISRYRKKIDKQKKTLYGSWLHDAIAPYPVSCDKQTTAKCCNEQLKEYLLGAFENIWMHGRYFSTSEDLAEELESTDLYENFMNFRLYDISLEGQRDQWDIMRYSNIMFYDAIQQTIDFREDLDIERLTKLVTELLPVAAQPYLTILTPNDIEKIKQQLDLFPNHLFRFFRKSPKEFVKTLYYARIPRRYLDTFLSGIALVQAYEKIHPSCESTSQSDTPNHFSKDVSNTLKEKLNGEVATEGGEDEGIVEELLPVFKDDKEAARKFLAFARNHKGTMVTERVTQLAAEKKIDNKYAKTTLHKILNQHGIYTYSLSNWNKQVKLKWD